MCLEYSVLPQYYECIGAIQNSFRGLNKTVRGMLFIQNTFSLIFTSQNVCLEKASLCSQAFCFCRHCLIGAGLCKVLV